MRVLRATTRGQSRTAWLDSRHTFSFGQYQDRARMGISALRVINDDLVIPGAGFATHGHRDMEILSYVTRGTMQHRDSTGEAGEIPAGQFQLMSAGSGIRHSEFNASATDELAFLQVWIVPAQAGGAPRYQQVALPRAPGLHLVASPDGPLQLRQDARVSRLELAPQAAAVLPLQPDRVGYVHVIQGTLRIDGELLAAGDGAAFSDQADVTAHAVDGVEALWFDLPGA